MGNKSLTSLAVAGLLFVSIQSQAQFADSVVSYTSGSGVAANFANPNAALGEPARVNPFGESVDPFNPPYGTNQIVSLGAGGTLTLRLDTPVVNDPSHLFGVDFIVFGNAGFVITNGDFSGGGITDGSLFANNTGVTRLSVSLDNVTYYTLNPALAPVVDGLFPTDGNGNFHKPVDPSRSNADFSGKDLGGIRGLYSGAGGGTGYDLAWAQDSDGNSQDLSSARFVRIEVLTGKSEIDAIAVVPEPATWALAAVGAALLGMKRRGLVLLLWPLAAFRGGAATIPEEFASDPAVRGWGIFGDTNLFHWNSANQNLEATWDSSRTNSFFYRRLDTVLTGDDDFEVAFDLRLSDIAVGVNPNKSSTFELAAGFLNLANATSTNFQRGTGINPAFGPRNLAEFDYFPDSGFGATISPTLVSSNNQFAAGFEFPLELTPGDWFHLALNYNASNRTLATMMTRNGLPFGPIKDVKPGAGFTDFRLDAFAVISYSDAGADGSILAHGVVDNVVVTVPGPPIRGVTGRLTNNTWQVEFGSGTNWLYTLERTEDFRSWRDVAVAIPGVDGQLELSDPDEPGSNAYFRVRAERR